MPFAAGWAVGRFDSGLIRPFSAFTAFQKDRPITFQKTLDWPKDATCNRRLNDRPPILFCLKAELRGRVDRDWLPELPAQHLCLSESGARTQAAFLRPLLLSKLAATW